MGMKQNIVIVNEFTENGSRGATPGAYVERYMARDGRATETVTPVSIIPEPTMKLMKRVAKDKKIDLNEDEVNDEYTMFNYLTRYVARDTATEHLIQSGESDQRVLEDNFDKIQGYSGIAFSPKSIALTHKDFKDLCNIIQEEHDKGKPVLKTVISFDTDYLKQMGVMEPDAEINKRGDLYGKTDQAKLRMAIQNGLKTISNKYSDLDYVGVIQVDTMHVHCHLAMVDKGDGKRFTKKGEQKGMIDDAMKNSIRRGIDNSLQQYQLIKPLTIQMDSEQRNTIGYVKRFVNKVIEERGIPQYLIACLPKDDKSLWKASINTDAELVDGEETMTIKKGGKEKKIKGNMKKANQIMRDYITGILNRPDSNFQDAIRAQHMYHETRKNRGDFDDYYVYKPRVKNGEKRIVKIKVTPDEAVRAEDEKYKDNLIEKCMNATYDILKGIDNESMIMRTPFIDAMSLPYEEMLNYVKDDKLIEFGFKLRSYSSRLDYHTKHYEKVNQALHDYEDGDQSTYDPESKVVYDFLKIEQEYNHSLMCKYRSFLHFYHVKDEYKDDFEDLMIKRHTVNNRMAMKNDKSLKRAKDDAKAEEDGIKLYGLKGAGYLVTNPEIFDQIMNDEMIEYGRSLRNFHEKLAGFGLLYNEDTNEVTEGLKYEFDDVKAYDLHHMLYDFTYDFRISMTNIDNFVEMSNKRYEAYQKALDYLDRSGQPDALVGVVNEVDITSAKELADTYVTTGDTMYHNKYDDSSVLEMDSSTIRLRHPIYEESLGNKQLARMFNLMINASQNEHDDANITVIKE